jgi:alpha-glucosidase
VLLRYLSTGDWMLKILTLALVLALLACPAANAAAQDSNIEWDGLFHDQGPLFTNTNEPDSKTPLSVRFRAFNKDLTSANIKYFDASDHNFHDLPMKRESTKPDAVFEYWQATIPASPARKYYRFALHDGSTTAWYNARGSVSSEPADGDFYVVPGFKTPTWLKDGIIYQIFPDRFNNGDTANDVTDGKYKYAGVATIQRHWGESPVAKNDEDRSLIFYGGDLNGIIAKLNYIRTTIGANVVYLNPIFKSPSNHKYDTSDYDVVDPAFGTNEQLAQLSASLHNILNGKRGYLILDGVFNHTGDSHKWFGKYDAIPGVTGAYQSLQSPYRSFYTFKSWPNKYAMFLTYDSLPKLNFASKALKYALYVAPDSVALKYLKAPFNIDGWRLDAPKYVDSDGRDGSDNFNHEIWRQFRTAVKSVNPQAALIGENWENANAWTASGDQWDSVTNFDAFTQPVSEWITGRSVGNDVAALSVSEFERWLRLTRANYPTNVQQVLSNHLSNHDIARFAERAHGDIWKTNLALFFQMTYVGTPTIYYGDEYGMEGGADPDCRRTFDWTKADSNNPTIALTHKLIAVRNKYPALRTGSFMALKVDDVNNVFQFARLDKQNQIAVVLNNASTEKTVDVPIRLMDLPDNTMVKDEISGSSYQVKSGKVTVMVPGHCGAILVH